MLTYEQLNEMYAKAMAMSSVTEGFRYLNIAFRILAHMRQKNRREYAEFCKNQLNNQ